MSIFGTLGKKGRRKASVTTNELSLKDQSEISSTIFKSTPNLYAVNGEEETAAGSSQFDSPSGLVYYDYEKNPRTPFKIFNSHGHGGGGGGGSADVIGSNSSLSSVSHSVASEGTNRHGTPEKPPLSAFRGFVSLVHMASGIRKTKSMRRKVFASASHLRTTDHSPMTEHEGVIHEDTPVYSSSSATTPRRSFSTHRTVSIKSSHSVPNMEGSSDGHRLRSVSRGSVDDVEEHHILRHRQYNGEPGVESSSSLSLSSACTNPSENESCASSRSRCPSVTTRSDNFDPDAIISQPPEDPEIERRKLMLQGAKKFNMDPKKGIDFLVLNGVVDRTPESVAQFLKHGEQLSKSSIGNYLGEHHQFNLDVLNAFVELHDFTNVLLVEALRQFLWSFRLPGEAQKIDRMMECFAKRYTHLNPTLFANSDTCYLLSFAIIMLNTSLHNPNVKEKPSLEQFIQMNRDIDDGQPLDRKFVTSLYNSILTEPFQIPPEDGNDLMLTFFNPAIEGWLWKQGGRYKTWKRRWFILNHNCLYYFLFTTDKDPRGIIPLENIRVRRAVELGKEFCFTLFKESSDPKIPDYIKSCKASDGKLTAGKHIRYHLATKTKEDRDRWIAAIASNSSFNNFYTILAQKKSRLEGKGKGTLKRNKTILENPPQRSVSSVAPSPSPGAVRKSQIGLPLTRSDFAKSTSQLPNPELLSPDSNFGRDPHDYFTSATASTSNLSFGGSDESFGGHGDSETSSQISFEVSDSDLRRRTLEGRDSGGSHYNTFSLPRTKSRKHHHHHLRTPPQRKFSLPPDSLPSRLTSKVEYLTSPGIRISVEDTEASRDESVEKVILDEGSGSAAYFPNGEPSPVPAAPSEINQGTSADLKETRTNKDTLEPIVLPPPAVEGVNPPINSTPLTERSSSTLINALKDFANVMENLNFGPDVEADSKEDEWAEMQGLSTEELRYSGLTKQCLRSSFKSKRSRYRNKPRKYGSGESKLKRSSTGIRESLGVKCDRELPDVVTDLPGSNGDLVTECLNPNVVDPNSSPGVTVTSGSNGEIIPDNLQREFHSEV